MHRQIGFIVLACASVLSAADLPSAEVVFNKAVQATGGKAAYEKTNSMINKGAIEIVGQNVSGDVVIAMAKPDKTSTVMDLEGVGKMRMGTGGGIAWQTSDFQGPRVLDGEERDQMIRASSMDNLVRWHEVYGDVKVDGEEMVDGKSCWRLVATPPKATKAETFWFEKDSGLLVKTAGTAVTAMGEMATESKFSDFRDVSGIKVPYSIRQTVGPQVIQITTKEVIVNPNLPATQFEPPADIQAMLTKK